MAILAHLFSYDITWSATKKEVERSNFFKEVPRILKRWVLVVSLHTSRCSPGIRPLELPAPASFRWHSVFPAFTVPLPYEMIRSVLIRNHTQQVLVPLPRVHRAYSGDDYRQHPFGSLSMAAYRKWVGRHPSACVGLFPFLVALCPAHHPRITGSLVHANCCSQ